MAILDIELRSGLMHQDPEIELITSTYEFDAENSKYIIDLNCNVLDGSETTGLYIYYTFSKSEKLNCFPGMDGYSYLSKLGGDPESREYITLLGEVVNGESSIEIDIDDIAKEAHSRGYKYIQLLLGCDDNECEDISIVDTKPDTANNSKMEINGRAYWFEDSKKEILHKFYYDPDVCNRVSNFPMTNQCVNTGVRRIIGGFEFIAKPRINSVRWFHEELAQDKAYILITTNSIIDTAFCDNIGDIDIIEFNHGTKTYKIEISGLEPAMSYEVPITVYRGNGSPSETETITVYTMNQPPEIKEGNIESHIDYAISSATSENSIITDAVVSNISPYATIRKASLGHIEAIKLKPDTDLTISITFESIVKHNEDVLDYEGNVVNMGNTTTIIDIEGHTKQIAHIEGKDLYFYDESKYVVFYDDNAPYTVKATHWDYHENEHKKIWEDEKEPDEIGLQIHAWDQSELDTMYKQWPVNLNADAMTYEIITNGSYKNDENADWYKDNTVVTCTLNGNHLTGHINIDDEGNNFKRSKNWVFVNGSWRRCIMWVSVETDDPYKWKRCL